VSERGPAQHQEIGRTRPLTPGQGHVLFIAMVSGCMALVMSGVMSGVMTAWATGLDAGLPLRWEGAFVLAWPLAFCTAFMVVPRVRWFVDGLVER
jgi:hypothetical protein